MTVNAQLSVVESPWKFRGSRGDAVAAAADL